MATGIKIKSIVSNNDGSTCLVALSGTPNGAVSFVSGRTPDVSKSSSVSASEISSTEYTITFSAPVLWYVWATDTDGTTASYPVWIGLTADTNLNSCGLTLQSILLENKPAIDIALSAVIPGTKIKDVVFGDARAIRDFPSILITKPSERFEWIAFPYVKQVTYEFQIYCMVLHQDRTPFTLQASKFASVLMAILNQKDYVALSLPTGIELSEASTHRGDVEDVGLDDNKFASIVSIIWTALANIQDCQTTPGI